MRFINLSSIEFNRNIYDFFEFLRFIKKCNYLENFYCNYVDLSFLKNVDDIIDAFEDKIHLKEFTMNFCKLKFFDESNLRKFLIKKQELEKLEIYGNSLKIQIFNRMLEEMEKNNCLRLKHIGFSLTNFNDCSFDEIDELVLRIRQSNWLKNLDSLLFSADSKETFAILYTILESTKSLKCLKIEPFGWFLSEKENLNEYFPHFETTLARDKNFESFRYYPILRNDHLCQLQMMTNLTNLTLQHSNLTNENIHYLDKIWADLEIADISFNPINDNGLIRIIDRINEKKIKVINFQDTERTWEFVNYLQEKDIHFIHLNYLNLRKYEENESIENILIFLKKMSGKMINIEKLFLNYGMKILDDFEFSQILLNYPKLIIFNYTLSVDHPKLNKRRKLPTSPTYIDLFNEDITILDTSSLVTLKKRNKFKKFQISSNLNLSHNLKFYKEKKSKDFQSCFSEMVIDFDFFIHSIEK